jgi:hypothetical protein
VKRLCNYRGFLTGGRYVLSLSFVGYYSLTISVCLKAMKIDQLNRSMLSLDDDSFGDCGSMKVKQSSLMQFFTLISNSMSVSLYSQ